MRYETGFFSTSLKNHSMPFKFDPSHFQMDDAGLVTVFQLSWMNEIFKRSTGRLVSFYLSEKSYDFSYQYQILQKRQFHFQTGQLGAHGLRVVPVFTKIPR